MNQPLVTLLAAWSVLSVVTFFVYGFDKRAARRGEWRVPERSLHLLASIGGWPGAYLGQRAFRHKTSKASFRRVFWLTGLVPAATLAALIYLRLH